MLPLRNDESLDVGVYARAARIGILLGEQNLPGGSQRIDRALQTGLKRANSPGKGLASQPAGTWVCRAYRSTIDGSLQPYAIKFPKGYGESQISWPLEVVLHGRSDGLTEALFLNQHEPGKVALEKNVVVEVFGRGNNAYRWAGETDVFEVIGDTLRREKDKIDPKRVVLRGFSMGGAGTWHLGLHHADRFCAIQPGAGFTRTIGYAKTVPADLPFWQREILRRYDAVDAARNVAMVATVAYSGADDPQKEAALNIERALAGRGEPDPSQDFFTQALGADALLKARIKHLIAPGLAHKMPPEWKKKVDDAIEPHVAKGLDTHPAQIDWTANSERHGKCHWIQITGLKGAGSPGRVVAQKTATEYRVVTQGIDRLALERKSTDPTKLILDGTEFECPRAGAHHWILKGKTWQADPEPLGWRKRPGLQGPIDDAFMDGFIVTLGTGKPWSEPGQKRAVEELERFRLEWTKWMRGDFPFVAEEQITAQMQAEKHLVVFGDPGSSKILAQTASKLPYPWQAGTIEWRGQAKSAETYLPFSVQPNPNAPGRYLVVNSGHTFHEEQFKGTNALLFSQFGDFGLYHCPTGIVHEAGLFDKNWKFSADAAR